MNENNFTPGPWEVEITDEGRVWIKESTTPEGIIICDIPGDMETIEREQMADAQLIAAAPELLAACEEALTEAKERGEDLGANCWPQLRAAIAKAKGGAA